MGFEAGIVVRHGDSYKDNDYFWSTCGWDRTNLVDTLIRAFSDNEYSSINDLAGKTAEGAFDFEVEKLGFFQELRERLMIGTHGIYKNLRELYVLELDDVADEYFESLSPTEKVAFYRQFYFEDTTKLNLAKSLLLDIEVRYDYLFIINSLADAYNKLQEEGIDTAEFYISY